MATPLPPIPNNPVTDTFVWRDWFYKVSQILVQQASIAWTSIDFTGSNLRDIQVRQHNALQSIDGGGTYHLSAGQYASISTLTNVHNNLTGLQGGTTNEYYHLTAAEHTAVQSVIVQNYGSFSSITTQSVSTINTPTQVTFDTTDYANNFTLTSNKLQATNSGLYNVQFSIQLTNSDTQNHDMDIWIRKGSGSGTATDVANTASVVTVNSTHGGQPGYQVTAANFFIQMAANDFLEFWWASNSTQVQLQYLPAITTPFTSPGAPAIVVTLTQVA